MSESIPNLSFVLITLTKKNKPPLIELILARIESQDCAFLLFFMFVQPVIVNNNKCMFEFEKELRLFPTIEIFEKRGTYLPRLNMMSLLIIRGGELLSFNSL